MLCESLAGPEAGPSTRGEYPALATARFTGETRDPLAVRPSGIGHYVSMAGNLSLGWLGEFMRMRYDFGMGSQVSVQTYEQAQRGDTGATLGIIKSMCFCEQSLAGNMHLQSFQADDPLDPLRLSPEAGGAAYLGRVRVTLDGDIPESRRVAVADHYMKWAFHFLVDADEASQSFGLPLRLYGPYGVLQVFEGWKLGDPSEARPNIWKMPKGCSKRAASCSNFEPAGPSEDEPEIVI